ncbi:MAG TPA: hypothetical protein VFV67_28765 [Actinophytocola sp.]|uniref:hypothetical protein n=1 Tax=Actinophytocola sp. TaxID=1872138 RepID=UPI002DBB55A6|nr:hypothetical protein [Actinophytocola sp.]HEU5474659.1 hypothetical protein [Actinophytocola sp.]
MPEYRIARLGSHGSRFVTQIAELINDALGQGSCRPERLLRQLHDTEHGVFTVHATATDTVLAAAIVRVFDDDGYARWQASKSLTGIVPAAAPSSRGRRVAHGDEVSVRPETRGCGIGRALQDHVNGWLSGRRVTDFYAPLWNPRSLARAREIAHRRASTIVAEIPDYWTEESLAENWHCPRCGQPCHCPAYLMHTPLNRSVPPA